MRHPRHEIRRKRRKLLPQKAGAMIRAGDPRQRVAAKPRRPRENWGAVHRTVLPNGLRVLTARAPGPPLRR